jgi:V8-like Glu-specific endopeptidase
VDGRAAKVKVIPGNNAAKEPYGSCAGTTAYSVHGWMDHESSLYDYGAFKLNCNIGRTTGTFGLYWTTSALSGTVAITGYAGDKKPDNSMWTASGKLTGETTRQVYYTIATAGGQSGSPVYRKGCGLDCVVAIHTEGIDPTHPGQNAGTRITMMVFDNMEAWR